MRRINDYLAARWDADVQDRFWRKVERTPECWTWVGTITPGGYGQFSVDSRHYAAHRLLFVKTHGEQFDGLICDHLCRNRRCVNPAHIEAVTESDNVSRGDAARLNRERGQAITHCPFGHEYTPKNTRLTHGSRTCRACDRVRAARWNAKRKVRARSTGGDGDE